MLKELLPYYEQELTFLRQLSKEFATENPAIARHLKLEGEGECPDPHVERLIEAFAFLTARIHKKLDDEFPEITEALLGILYPHYLRPTPSMAIVQFQIDPKETQLTSRHLLKRHTPLLSQPVKGMACRFRTCYPVELWPLQITEARCEPIERSTFTRRPGDAVAVIRLRLCCVGEVTLPALSQGEDGLKRLRFYLAGESPLMHALYELLCNNVQEIELATGEGTRARRLTLPKNSLQPVGFSPEENLLDYDNRSFLGYRLLHEYFVFPEKFLFFDLHHLDEAGRAGFERDLEIAIYLSEFERPERLARLVQTVNTDTFRLGCTPVINLFSQPGEPIRLSHQKTEYPVIPDIRRPWGVEVYSIDSVRNVVSYREQEEITDIQPFYALKHHYSAEAPQTAFWYETRRPTAYKGKEKDDKSTDVFISLVDLAFNPTVPKVETLSLSLTCTNRDLPGQLPFGGGDNDFDIEGGSPISRSRCLTKPTPTLRPPLRQGAQWRLISHLALNYLSLTENGREALLEILSLYNFSDSAAIKKQIAGITKVSSQLDIRRVVQLQPKVSSQPGIRRVVQLQRIAFVRGTAIELEFDETQYSGSGIYLFASVLEHFFGHYCALNSFTQLTVHSKQREKAVATWPPRIGAAILV